MLQPRNSTCQPGIEQVWSEPPLKACCAAMMHRKQIPGILLARVIDSSTACCAGCSNFDIAAPPCLSHLHEELQPVCKSSSTR